MIMRLGGGWWGDERVQLMVVKVVECVGGNFVLLDVVAIIIRIIV